MAKRFDAEVYERRVRPLLQGWMAERTRADLEELAGDQVPLTAVKDIGDVVNDPHIRDRDMIVDVDYPDFGQLEMFGQPIHLGATPATPRGLAPKVGEHTETLLRGLLDLSDDEIGNLRQSGVV